MAVRIVELDSCEHLDSSSLYAIPNHDYGQSELSIEGNLDHATIRIGVVSPSKPVARCLGHYEWAQPVDLEQTFGITLALLIRAHLWVKPERKR